MFFQVGVSSFWILLAKPYAADGYKAFIQILEPTLFLALLMPVIRDVRTPCWQKDNEGVVRFFLERWTSVHIWTDAPIDQRSDPA